MRHSASTITTHWTMFFAICWASPHVFVMFFGPLITVCLYDRMVFPVFFIQRGKARPNDWELIVVKGALLGITVLKSLAYIFHIYVIAVLEIFYIRSHPWFFFLSVLPLWHFSTLIDYYFKFLFDLTAILYIAKDDFIHGEPLQTVALVWPETLMQSHRWSWTLMHSHRLSWTLMHSHRLSWTLMHSHRLSWTLMHCHRLSWTLIHSHRLSWTLMHCHRLSWTLIHFHRLSWTLIHSHREKYKR